MKRMARLKTRLRILPAAAPLAEARKTRKITKDQWEKRKIIITTIIIIARRKPVDHFGDNDEKIKKNRN